MIGDLLHPIISQLCMVVGYVFGIIPTYILSFGAVDPGPLGKTRPHAYYRSKGMKWWHLTYVDKGTRYLPAEGVALIGWLMLVFIAGFSILLAYGVTLCFS